MHIWEKGRYKKTIRESKFVSVTGISPEFQQLFLHDDKDAPVMSMEGYPQDTKLGAFPIDNYWTIRVIDTNPSSVKGQFTDVSLVKKFELTEEEYEKRS
ncbi:hypothetical protein BGX34_010654, partial [Mortierella sp. NVP85]